MAFDFKTIQDANGLACSDSFTAVKDQATVNSPGFRVSSHWVATGDPEFKEALPPLRMPEVTSQLPFADSLYLE